LKERGFVVLCTLDDERFHNYLSWESGLAVCAGTPEMIKELAEKGLDEAPSGIHLWSTGIPEQIPPEYDLSVVHLKDDSKLTDELLEEYGKNSGKSVKVIVRMGWVGEWTDPHEAAYAAVGMTEKEFTERNDLTDEQVEKYLETLRRHTYWVRPEVVEPLLKDGELVEVRSWMWDFVAELTYERALELSKSKQITYIQSFDYEEKCYEWQRKTTHWISADD